MKRLYKIGDINGKVVKSTTMSNGLLFVYFTDDSYILFEASSNIVVDQNEIPF